MIERIRRDLGYYVRAHQNRTNVVLHYFAFLAAFLGWIFLFLNLWVTLILAIVHYALAWTGHFLFEGNKPAGLNYPWIGFYAGFLWFFIKTVELLTFREDILDKFLCRNPHDVDSGA